MRRSPLSSDPAKTAAWQARSRAKALRRTNRVPTSRSTLKRSTGLRARRPKRRVVTPPDVWAAVLARDGGLCVWSKHLGRKVRAEHPHHILPKGVDGWPQYAATKANICALSPDRHMTHEHSPNDRLPWAALPVECQAFLRDVCANDARAARFVQTKYPGAEL